LYVHTQISNGIMCVYMYYSILHDHYCVAFSDMISTIMHINALVMHVNAICMPLLQRNYSGLALKLPHENVQFHFSPYKCL